MTTKKQHAALLKKFEDDVRAAGVYEGVWIPEGILKAEADAIFEKVAAERAAASEAYDLACEGPAQKPAKASVSIEAIIAERDGQHGNWREQSNLSQSLKTVMGLDMNAKLRPDEREALELICVKISRILCGDAHLEDHWRDIAGYATLAADQNKSA